MKHLIWLSLVMLLTACGPDSKTEKYTYSLNENGCMTGQHKFSTLIEYCAGLKNDELNNNCAWSLRKGTYERDCGTDWAFYSGN